MRFCSTRGIAPRALMRVFGGGANLLALSSACGGATTEGECHEARERIRGCLGSGPVTVTPTVRLPSFIDATCSHTDRCLARCVNSTSCAALAQLAPLVGASAPDPLVDPTVAKTLAVCIADCLPCNTLFDPFRQGEARPCTSP